MSSANDNSSIEAGREAWAAVHKATTFEAWKAIATALAIGRQKSLQLARVNAPHGIKYARAFNAWLDQKRLLFDALWPSRQVLHARR
jgi:hypothetical protein